MCLCEKKILNLLRVNDSAKHLSKFLSLERLDCDKYVRGFKKKC